MNKRDAFHQVKNFIDENRNEYGEILVLYGLQNTGKKTIMHQIIKEYEDKEQCAYYTVQNSDTMDNIIKFIINEMDNGTTLICLDEITRASDFITEASVLPDIFAKQGMKIIVSGTDSLKFIFAEHELYGRTQRVNTTYISLAEYCRIYDTKDIDKYIQYGGIMGDYANDETVKEYINKAVTENIVASVQDFPRDKGIDKLPIKELETIIHKMLEIYSGVGKLSDLETDEMIDCLQSYLLEIDVISASTAVNYAYTEVEGWKERDTKREFHIIQPAIKYYYLHKSIEQIENDKVKSRLDLQIRECMIQQIVLYDVSHHLSKEKYIVEKIAFTIEGQAAGEYDLLIYDIMANKHWDFAVKYANEPLAIQEKYLRNEHFSEISDYKYGERAQACILYNGKSLIAETGMLYINVVDFVLAVEKYRDIETVIKLFCRR